MNMIDILFLLIYCFWEISRNCLVDNELPPDDSFLF